MKKILVRLLFMFLTAALPFIAIVAVMAIVIIIIRKAKKRK